jgi:glycosyltransferase involved in cell wall biosynthesis
LNYYPEHGAGELLPWQEEINRVLLEDAPKADVRISVSRWQKEFLFQSHKISTVYVPNGVDVSMCAGARAERFQRLYSIRNFVLYVGRQDPVKNPQEFVELASAMPELCFVMVGRGLEASGQTGPEMQSHPPNLITIGDVPHQTVLDAIAACDVLVVTSRREGLPTLVLEALALDKPIVVPNDPGCVEAIDHGKYGWIYELGSIDELVDRTRSAIANRRPPNDSREWVADNYDWRVVARRLDEIYSA